MNRPAKNIDSVSVMRATDHAKNYTEETVRISLLVIKDPDKKTRIECQYCHYMRSKIGGSCMTDQSCGLCGKDQTYCNTCTDALCAACAEKHELCKHCGGDLHMRVRRVFAP